MSTGIGGIKKLTGLTLININLIYYVILYVKLHKQIHLKVHYHKNET